MPRGEWTGGTAGVFRNALALAHPDGLWVTVLRSREDMEARALWPGEEAFDALAAGAAPGGPARFRESPLPGLSLGGLTVFFEPLEVWDSRSEVGEAARLFSIAGPAVFREAADRIGKALEKTGYAEGIHGKGVFGARFAVLRQSPDFPWNLVGFGPGTTPAGDDFLAGWLLGRRLRNGCRSEGTGIDLSRTTAPGRTLLAGALAGVFPAYLARTARALAAASRLRSAREAEAPVPAGDADWGAACRAAFGHGASSGRDALLGLREGLR